LISDCGYPLAPDIVRNGASTLDAKVLCRDLNSVLPHCIRNRLSDSSFLGILFFDKKDVA
jgi:hypothetical protein